MAPLSKIPDKISNSIDLMIRSSVKSIIGLPANTSTAMFYAPRQYRGLAILNWSWEKYLQHLSISQTLKAIDDPLIQCVPDLDSEILFCQKALDTNLDTSRKIRKSLRLKSFHEWSQQKWQGLGVQNFATFPKCNNFITTRHGLSSSEWTAAIKLNTNYANLRGVPGVSSESTLCRRCGKEKETPFHVIGSCSYNGLLINSRHHNTKHQLRQLLEKKGYHCYEEVFAVDCEGSRRFSDIFLPFAIMILEP